MIYIRLKWKSFNLDLETVEKWMRNNAGDHYVGNLASSDALELFFSAEPGQEIREEIQSYWSNIKKTHAVANNYVSDQEIRDAIAAAKADMVTKTWDQMSVAQRKIAIGETPTKDDLGL